MDTKPKTRVVNCTCTTIDDGIPSSLTPVVVFLSSGTAIALSAQVSVLSLVAALPG